MPSPFQHVSHRAYGRESRSPTRDVMMDEAARFRRKITDAMTSQGSAGKRPWLWDRVPRGNERRTDDAPHPGSGAKGVEE